MDLMRRAGVEQVPEGAQGNKFVTRYVSVLICIEGAGELLDLCRMSSSPESVSGRYPFEVAIHVLRVGADVSVEFLPVDEHGKRMKRGTVNCSRPSPFLSKYWSHVRARGVGTRRAQAIAIRVAA